MRAAQRLLCKVGAPSAAAATAASSSSSATLSSSSASSPHPSEMLTAEGRPFHLVHREVSAIRHHIASLLEKKDNEVLDKAASYAIAAPGKMLRPSLVCLMGYATMPRDRAQTLQRDALGDLEDVKSPHSFRRHIRLAEVTELIHTASLVHDDVIDDSATRRGRQALHVKTSTKTAVLAGDFMLARASYWIGTLDCNDVVILMTRALEDLIQGEIMQMNGCFDIDSYMAKSYCKTASLIDRSLSSAAILSSGVPCEAGSGSRTGSGAIVRPVNEEYVQAASEFGRSLGIAFQIVDDCLDLTGTESTMGKPKLGDLKEGIATLPILLAAQHDSAVDAAVRRRFSGGDEDIALAIKSMEAQNTVTTALMMADDLCRTAINALNVLPDSDAKVALQHAAGVVLNRQL